MNCPAHVAGSTMVGSHGRKSLKCVSALVARVVAADCTASSSKSSTVWLALFRYPFWLSGVGKLFPGCVVSPRSAATVLLYSLGLSRRTRTGIRALLGVKTLPDADAGVLVPATPGTALPPPPAPPPPPDGSSPP